MVTIIVLASRIRWFSECDKRTPSAPCMRRWVPADCALCTVASAPFGTGRTSSRGSERAAKAKGQPCSLPCGRRAASRSRGAELNVEDTRGHKVAQGCSTQQWYPAQKPLPRSLEGDAGARGRGCRLVAAEEDLPPFWRRNVSTQQPSFSPLPTPAPLPLGSAVLAFVLQGAVNSSCAASPQAARDRGKAQGAARGSRDRRWECQCRRPWLPLSRSCFCS